MQRARRYAVRILCVLTASAVLPGCHSFHAARSTEAPAVKPIHPGAWFVHGDAEQLRELAQKTHRLIDQEQGGPREHAQPVVFAAEFRSGGLFRRWQEPGVTDRAPRPDGFIREFLVVEPNAALLMPHRLERSRRSWLIEEALNAEDGVTGSAERDAATMIVLRLGIRMRLSEVVDSTARGLVVYLPAMFPNVFEYRVVQAFEESGWETVFVDTDIRVECPNEDAIIEAMERQRRFVARALRAAIAAHAEAGDDSSPPAIDSAALYEEASRRYPVPGSGFQYTEWDDHAALGRAIAAAVDEVLRDHALAAEAAVDHLFGDAACAAGRPIIVLGFSGGALMAPAVAARLRAVRPEAPLALILVGSGGDLLSASMESAVTDGGIGVTPEGERLPESVRAPMVEAYRAASHLDPLRAIKALRDVPVLHVYATRDRSVPTMRALALNQAHGAPARIVYRGGHVGLFYFLPRQRERIVRWGEAAVGRSTE